MPKNYTLRFLLFLFLFLCGHTNSQAQINNEQEGMVSKPKNYSTFSVREINQIDEWKKHNLPEYFDHPEFGKLPKDAPCQECVEDLSKRSADERYFIDLQDPSKFYQQKALGNLHGQQNDDWVTIDHSLTPVSTGVYESGFTQEQAGFDLAQHKVYIKTIGGTVYFNNWSAHILLNGESTSLGTFSWENYTVGDDGVYITEAFPGIDAEMIVFRGAIKTNFILKSNEFGIFDYLVFRDQFTAPETTSMHFDDSDGTQGTGGFSVHSGTSNLLQVGEALLFAKNGPKELVQSGEYVLNGNTMDLRVPYSWINANIGSYNLIVDPVVTGTATLAQASITGSMYNGSCNFTNSCNYNLVVSRPANATLTNVAWTFTYSANGTTCWLQDGGIRIAAGGCVSPATAGYYWFCNATGGGTCAGTNQTIWSDVAACMPAPGCTPQNVTFTLQFFRSCWGGAGCGNACIGAGSPWTMTITGQTINYTNTVTPITLSATTVCAGGSITASTTGQYGVPGYTYNWSFSPTGIPSIGTGASTSITFPTAGSVTLYSIVTDACGNQVVSSRVVTVTPGPTVTVNSPTICAGASAVLTASGATTYTWTPTATLSSGTGTSVTATPAATTTYTVVGTTAGCTGTTTSTVTVNPLPVITVNSPTICIGGTAALTASGATTYTWTPAATLSSGTGTSVTATPAATTTYTVTGTTGTCTGTATATVTVVPTPVISVNSPTICAGASAPLTASGGTTYTWSPSATLSSGTGTSVTANPVTTTTYTIVGTTGTCSGTTTATVTVNPNPVVTVNSATICDGSSAALTASGAATYTWAPTATLSGGTGTSVTATPTTTTTYTVTGTTGTCTGTATATVTVNPNPVVVVNSPAICAGASATLTASGATTYAWSPSATLSSGTGTSVTATPAATTTYTIVGTTGSCTGTATATVTVNANPVISVNSPTICAGASDILTATGAASYTWTPSATLSSGTGTSVTATPAATTTYTVTGTTGTCTGTATATVTVNPNPVITVLNPTICAGASATLNASGATTYTWSPAATLSSGTGTTVTATPATTTTYTIVGTTGTCTGTATSTVTVNPVPVISVNNPTICAGASATVTPTGAGTYTWTPAATLSSSVGSPVIATPAVTTTYTITGTLAGCTNMATATVTVTPNPVIAVNSPTICAGASDILTASGAASYSWTPAATLSSGTGASVTASPATTTTYTVTGTTGTCTGTATSTVTVNPLPVVTVNSPAMCAGASTTLSASGAASYSWTPGATLSSGTGNPVTASPAATTTYTVTGTTLGCSATASATVTVNPIPAISASNNGPLCPGQTLILTGNGQAGGTYSWSGPNSFLNSSQNPQIAGVSSADAGTYTVTITLNGCTNSAATTFALSPNVPSTINANGPFCQNDPVTILSAANPGGTWSGTGITNPATGAFDPALASIGNNTVTYQIAGGCNTSSTATVVVNGLPNPTFTSNVVDGCAPLNVQFTNTTAGASSVLWDFGNGSNSGAMNPSSVYNTVGCYPVSLEVTDANGCSNTAAVNSFICVLTSPNAQFMVGNAAAPVSNPVFQFVNSSTDAVSYLWNFGDASSGTIFSPSHTYDELAGSYLVQLIAYNAAGCSDTAHVIVTVKDEQIFYVPNAFTPNGDESNNTFAPVFTSGVDESNFSLVIFNRWGETLFETKNPNEGWDGTYHEQIVPSGSYVWSLRFKDPKSDDKFEFSGNVSVSY